MTGARDVLGSQQPLAHRISRKSSNATPHLDVLRAEDVSRSGTKPGSLRVAARGILLILGFLTVCGILSSPSVSCAAEISNQTTVIVVVGAPGQPEFGSNFLQQATLWQQACATGNCQCISLGMDEAVKTNDFELLRQTLANEIKEGPNPLWLVLIGHGTFDGKEARFNLRGPDVSANDLAAWLKPFRRPMAIINTASASAPFLNALTATNRVIITATRSGHEQNYARFGKFFAEAIINPESDLDKDGQVSLLEAFLVSSRHVAEFYKLEGRIATEHALFDDNGDGQGTPADWFQGLRPVKRPKDKAAVDGLLARQFRLIPSQEERDFSPEQRARRDRLERAILQLREKKSQLPEDDYYRQLETLLLEFARFNRPS